MQSAFKGYWRLTDLVFEPTGQFIGVIHQIRHHRSAENGRLRSEIKNVMDDAVRQHPIGVFEGTWNTELDQNMPLPRYWGPDITGFGVMLTPTVAWGRGNWPRFGHNFISFAVLVSPWRQMTCTMFHGDDVRAPFAYIFGIGMPESELGHTWPQVDHTVHAADIGRIWRGSLRAYNSQNVLVKEYPVQREYTRDGWIDSGPSGEIQQARRIDHGLWVDAQTVAGRVTPCSNIAAMAHMVDTRSGVYRCEYLEMLDAGSGTLICVRQWIMPNDIIHYDWAQLQISTS